MAFVSIQLNSNRPEQIRRFFDSVENTADCPEDIEVLLHIDTGDTVMEEVVEQEKRLRRFRLVSLQTDLVRGYSTLWKPLNPLLKLTDPEAYFLINLSDEMLFETKGWDSIIREYIGYYPDHLFRLRGSKYRFRNYTDYWECGFAPDSLAFYTRRWLELQGEWNPCLGPDSFQQCVSFYLMTSDPYSHRQFYRDVALPHLKFSGEGASIGLEGKALYRRMCINNRAWFVLMSHRIQQEARRRAMRMKSHMIAFQHGGLSKVALKEDMRRRRFVLQTKDGELIENVDYGLSWLRISLTTWLRAPLVLYFAGGGRETIKRAPFSSMALMMATFLPRGTSTLELAFKARDLRNHIRGVWQHHGPLMACSVLLHAMLKPLLPKRLHGKLRKYAPGLRDRMNHVRGVCRTHGMFAGIRVLVQSALLAILPEAPSRQLRRYKRFLRDKINHIRGVWQHHGAPAGSWLLAQSLLLTLLPSFLARQLRTCKHFLRDRSNHIRGVRHYHGILSSLSVFLQSVVLIISPPPLSRLLRRLKYSLRDLINHMTGTVQTHGFSYGMLVLCQSLLIALLPKRISHFLKTFKRAAGDFLNHLRGVKKMHGLAEGSWMLTRSATVRLSPRPLRRGIKKALYTAHHGLNHVKGVHDHQGAIRASLTLSQQTAAACLPRAVVIPLRRFKHGIQRKAGYVAHTYRVRGPLRASTVLAQESILAISPRPVGNSLRYVKRRLRGGRNSS